MANIVEFTPEAVKEHLDGAIRFWRQVKNDPNHELHDVAIYYCDAFQSLRISIFGELLPAD
jgi:hypothetical protein